MVWLRISIKNINSNKKTNTGKAPSCPSLLSEGNKKKNGINS